jgi:hypothetical protein
LDSEKGILIKDSLKEATKRRARAGKQLNDEILKINLGKLDSISGAI